MGRVSGREVSAESRRAADDLLTYLQLHSPLGRTFLLTSARGARPAGLVSDALVEAIVRAGHRARLVELGSDLEREAIQGEPASAGDGDLPALALADVERARDALISPDGFTVVCSPGLLVYPRALIAAAVVDGVVLLARQGKTARADLQEAQSRVEAAGGVVA